MSHISNVGTAIFTVSTIASILSIYNSEVYCAVHVPAAYFSLSCKSLSPTPLGNFLCRSLASRALWARGSLCCELDGGNGMTENEDEQAFQAWPKYGWL